MQVAGWRAYTKAPVTRLSISAYGSRVARFVWHDRLHSTVSVLDGLGAVRMCDELGLATWDAEGMLDVGGRSTAYGRSVCRDVPLRDTSGQLDVVVLLAIGVPLRDPARRQVRWGLCRAFAARRAWSGHAGRCALALERAQVRFAVHEEVKTGRRDASRGKKAKNVGGEGDGRTSIG